MGVECVCGYVFREVENVDARILIVNERSQDYTQSSVAFTVEYSDCMMSNLVAYVSCSVDERGSGSNRVPK